ncbi:hypothetical protein KR018_004547, partial [Drosophila ironensis]
KMPTASLWLLILLAWNHQGSLAQTKGPVTDMMQQCLGYWSEAVKPILDGIHLLQRNLIDIENRTNAIEQSLAKLESLKTEVSQRKQAKNLPGFAKIGYRSFYIERYHKMNWFAAQKACQNMGGQLAVIHNETERSAIHAQLNPDSYWLDINDLVHEGTYASWTSGKRAPFLKWQSGEPNNRNGRENCVDIYKGSMYDDRCEVLYYFICQADIEE